ncbi:MAG: hypothetical protein H0T51_25615, partial [Pirellulales bacterium]|nr:hypothetical protein [Pirellulales bacterium]
IPAARNRAEEETDRQIITARWRLTLPCFPCGAILLPKGRVQSVESVTYADVAGDDQPLVATVDWRLLADREPAELEPIAGYWPSVESGRRDAVRVEYTAGYGDEPGDVPALLRAGILFALGHLYENRQDVITGTISTELPQSAASIFEKFRVGDEFVNYEVGL